MLYMESLDIAQGSAEHSGKELVYCSYGGSKLCTVQLSLTQRATATSFFCQCLLGDRDLENTIRVNPKASCLQGRGFPLDRAPLSPVVSKRNRGRQLGKGRQEGEPSAENRALLH